MGKSKAVQRLEQDAILSQEQQTQVLKLIASITLLIFIPLGINNIFNDEIMLGAVLLAFEISLLLEISAIILNRTTLLSYYIPLALLTVSAVLAINVFGTLATYWLYPIVISTIFLLPRREALVTNVTMILFSSLAALQHQTPEVTLRYLISLVVTTIIVHVVVKAVRNLQAELRSLSVTDPMTGTYNRHELPAALERTIAQYPCSCIAIIDIDNFKQVNDDHGHDIGDKVIIDTVKTIKAVTTDKELLFRLGGDEFLLLIQDRDLKLAERLMNHLTNQVRMVNFAHQQSVTISSGVAESKTFEEIKEWMKRADLALYKSKHLGRNRVSVYTPALDDQLESRQVTQKMS
ncbi:GGDEF domain-containing protein [Vibrio aquaticus]|uniref:diguanylate cyclase n=1 Tax=Vibrio aquaticus TaxID=2496559 RepID=A0A432D118_9VIBR|nr:GGDEF domain-containing protein [Vibrio aquaticus]RTZ17558.1 GGDEF domain-containing protein [Vibrio aquaticus]